MVRGEEEITVQRNVPCPFCGLVCDDLTVSVAGGRLEVLENGCQLGREGFQRAANAPSPGGAGPRVRGQHATLEEAIAEAAGILGQSHYPLVAGLGAEGTGIRAAIQLADRLGGALDHMHGRPLMNHVRTLQDSGWVTTTLTEVRNRADLVILLGAPLTGHVPRLFDRILRPDTGLFPERLSRRRVVALGDPETDLPEGSVDELVPCSPEALGEVAEAMYALAGGHKLTAKGVGGIALADLEALVEQLRAADYGVIAWAAGAMGRANQDLTLGAVGDLIRELNRTTRCAGLPLGGEDGGQTALQATTWQTGLPVRVRFRAGYPEHTPREGSAEALLARGDPDALLWISAFDNRALPPRTEVPAVVLGQRDMALPEPPAVHIPVGTPGIDHGGPLFRCDGAVSLPLRALSDAPVPSVGEVLARIEAQL